MLGVTCRVCLPVHIAALCDWMRAVISNDNNDLSASLSPEAGSHHMN